MCDHDDGFEGLSAEELAFILALSESLAEERKELERLERELSKEDEHDDDA
jgi:hypothetical protein